MGITVENTVGVENVNQVEYSAPRVFEENKMRKERVGSAAFNLEYENLRIDAELRDDIVSYLGEYRLQVPKFEYELVFGLDQNNLGEGVGIRDVHRRESMRKKSQRAIDERRDGGKPVNREVAEDFALGFLESQLVGARSGDSILWGSPPGPKEQGYGDYGFIFHGQVQEIKDDLGNDEKLLKMKAIRVEGPTLLQYNLFFDEFTENPVVFESAEEFLASPVLIRGSLPEKYVDSALKKHFDFEIENQDQRVFEQVICELNPMIDEFVMLCKTGSNNEKLRAFNALENYALLLQEKYKTKFDSDGKVVFVEDYRIKERKLEDIVQDFGFKPPTVAGSCGSTESGSSLESITTSLFSRSRKEMFKKLGLEDGDEGFTCPKCGFEAIGPIGNQCPGCRVTKEQYAKESGAVICD